MSRKCYVCNKGILVGRNVSHANNRTRKVSQANLQRTKIKVNGICRFYVLEMEPEYPPANPLSISPFPGS